MAFSVKNTQQQTTSKNQNVLPPEKKITQNDIDFLDEQYKKRETLYNNFINTPPVNPLLDQYKKNLIKDPVYETEKIIYDPITGKWKLIKETK